MNGILLKPGLAQWSAKAASVLLILLSGSDLAAQSTSAQPGNRFQSKQQNGTPDVSAKEFNELLKNAGRQRPAGRELNVEELKRRAASSQTVRKAGQAKSSASEFNELLKKAREERPNGPIFSTKDIHHLYTPRRTKMDPVTASILRQNAKTKADLLNKMQSPRHRSSVLASPASMFGPLSLGPAYGSMMFQNSLNYWPYWSGPALPWNASIGARYLLSSGPLTIPYELALQHRLVMTTVTDTYGNQLVTLTDTGTGYSTQYQIINRLDGNPPPGTAGPVYGGGYYVSTYTGNIIGTNNSTYPGVFVPAVPYQTTFGYAGDLDTLGPFGRGHTPLNPPGPPPIFMPSVNPQFVDPNNLHPPHQP